jgi:hypothetical protein
VFLSVVIDLDLSIYNFIIGDGCFSMRWSFVLSTRGLSMCVAMTNLVLLR